MSKDTLHKEKNILTGYNMLLYFAGSMIMYEPSEECIADFWTQGILKSLPVSSSNPNFIKAASQLRDSCSDKKGCGVRLHQDYIKLLSEQHFPLAPPYESLYHNMEEETYGLSHVSVTDFYNSYGWKSKFRGKINDDHLGVELLFLTTMTEKYLSMDDEVCRIEMRKEIQRFINQHLLSWIRKWNEKMQSNADTLCYRGIATLILASTEDIFSFLKQNMMVYYERDKFKN